MKISDLKDKKVAIWGLGVEGKAVLKKLNEIYKDKEIIIINDKDIPQEKDKNGNNIYLLNLLKDLDIVIRSPGVSIYKPEIVYAKKEYNTIFITEKTIFFGEIEGNNVKTIAFTGNSGGEIIKIADITLNVPSDITNNIQEMHIVSGHIICGLVEKHFFG